MTLADKNKLIQGHVGVIADGIWGSQSADATMEALGINGTIQRPVKGLTDASAFFASIRGDMFDGNLDDSQVQGINAKLDAYGKAGWSIAWAAYAMATSYWETAHTMQPVREAYWLSETWRKNNLRYYPWYGRGDVQLTWEENYKKADRELDLGGSLVADPDRAMEPDISANIMVQGMEEGWFTSHSLGQHLPQERGTIGQFKEARRIINGTDKKTEIANIAMEFQDAFVAGGWS